MKEAKPNQKPTWLEIDIELERDEKRHGIVRPEKISRIYRYLLADMNDREAYKDFLTLEIVFCVNWLMGGPGGPYLFVYPNIVLVIGLLLYLNNEIYSIWPNYNKTRYEYCPITPIYEKLYNTDDFRKTKFIKDSKFCHPIMESNYLDYAFRFYFDLRFDYYLDCPLCLDTFTNASFICQLACNHNHVYHFSCLKK